MANAFYLDSIYDKNLSTKAKFESLKLAPRTENIAYRDESRRVRMKQIGLHLAEITEGDLSQRLAQYIEWYFWQELGLPHAPDINADSVQVKHMLIIDNKSDMKLALLANRLWTLTEPGKTVFSPARINLHKLEKYLELTDFEVRVLRWMYAVGLDGDSDLHRILTAIEIKDADHKYRILSALFSESLQAVECHFKSPCRLLGLGWLDPIRFHHAQNLADVFTATQELIDVLETPHRSAKSMRQYILEPYPNLHLIDDNDASYKNLYQKYPATVAESVEWSLRKLPLKPTHIASLVKWLSGYEFAPHLFDELTEDLDYEAIQGAIKRCCVENGRDTYDKEAIPPFALLSALYAAAGKSHQARKKNYYDES